MIGSRVRAPAATPNSSGLSELSLGVGLVGDLPDEARKFAGDGNRDGGAFLAAGSVEAGPAAMEPELRAPRGIDRGGVAG